MTMLRKDKLLLDLTNAEAGNFQAAVIGASAKKYKLQVKRGSSSRMYDLRSDGWYETYPLQYGDGEYEATLYENVSGKSYKAAGKIRFPVSLSRPDASQLVPNQYVNYSTDSPLVRTASFLCEGCNQEEAFRNICRYIKQTFRYDYVKALRVKPGMLPDIETTFRKKMGVCQDLAAVTVAMLRSQGVPAKLVIGWAGKQYHAWVSAMIDGKEKLFDPTAELSARKISRNYTVERWY